jgi:histone H1/5
MLILFLFLKMITEAIVSLKERTGSSQYAITKFIEEKHKELSPTYRKLVLLHLKKLVASEKLVKVKNSFKLAPATKTSTAPAKPKAAPVKAKSAAAKPKAVAKPAAKTASKPKAKTAVKPKAAAKPKAVAKPKAKTVKATPVKKAVKKVPAKGVKKPKSVKSPVKKAKK